MDDLAILTPDIEASGVYAFVEEINAVISTYPYESILDTEAGRANANFLIGKTHITAESAIEILKAEIRDKCQGSQLYGYTISVNFGKGSLGRDTIWIEIDIYNTDGTHATQYIHRA